MAAVLFVDDEPQVLEGFRSLLHGQPYAVLTASSAAEALATLARERVDVVVSDEAMPRMRGCELLTVIAQEYPQTVRVLLTGRADLESAVRAINEGGVFRYLRKPCKPAELMRTLDEALNVRGLAEASVQVLDFVRERAAALGVGSTRPRNAALPMAHVAVSYSSGPARSGARLKAVLSPDAYRAISRREREIVAHLAAGERVSDIAQTLAISPHTVRNHLKSVYQKLGVHSQGELLDCCRV